MINNRKWVAAILAVVMMATAGAGCGRSTPPVSSTVSEASTRADVSAAVSTEATSGVSGETQATQEQGQSSQTKPAGVTTTTAYRPPIEGVNSDPGIKEEPTPANFYDDIRGTTVRVYRSIEPDEQAMETAAAFTEKYGCTVKWIVVGWQAWKTRLLQGVAAGAPADYTIYYDNQLANLVANKVLQPVDPYIYIADPFWDKGVMGMFSWNGKNYGMNCTLGTDMNVGMIYYNKTMFEDAGEKEPIEYYEDGEWDFETFEKVAKRMTVDSNDDGVTDIYGFASWWVEWTLLANGNRLVKQNQDGSVDLTLKDQAAYNGLQLQANLAKAKAYLYNDQWADFFKARRVAMIFERPFNAIGSGNLLDSSVFKDEISICPPPKGPDAKKNYAPALFDTIGIPTGAQNPKGAAAYYYFSKQYDYEHRDDPERLAERRRSMTEEHEKVINDFLKTAVKINTIASSFGNWDGVKGQLWADILQKGISPSAAVESRYDQLKYEITDTMRALNN